MVDTGDWVIVATNKRRPQQGPDVVAGGQIERKPAIANLAVNLAVS